MCALMFITPPLLVWPIENQTPCGGLASLLLPWYGCTQKQFLLECAEHRAFRSSSHRVAKAVGQLEQGDLHAIVRVSLPCNERHRNRSRDNWSVMLCGIRQFL